MNQFRYRSIWLIILVFLTVIAVHPSYSTRFNNITFKINNPSQISSNLTGNVSLIIINTDYTYAQEQNDSILRAMKMNSSLLTNYPNLNFTVFYPENMTEAKDLTNNSFSSGIYQYIIHVGSSDVRTLISDELALAWDVNFTQVKRVGFIDSKSLSFRDNVTHIDFDKAQGGFITGLKSAGVSENSKIGVLLDYPILAGSSGFFTNEFFRFSETFLSAFIAGTQYASEHLLNRKQIDIKTLAVDRNNLEDESSTSSELDQLLNQFKNEFGADTVVNLLRGLDTQIIEKGNNLGLKIVTLGANQSNAEFSLVQNLDIALYRMIDYWNNTATAINNPTFLNIDLLDEEAMFLSDYNFRGDNEILFALQVNITNGKIIIPTLILRSPQATNGFALTLTFIVLSLVAFYKYTIKKKKQ